VRAGLTKLRYAWHEFFKSFDVLLTPVAATAAFSHDRNPNRGELPVGLQIIGPEGEDRTTIEFAPLLAAEIGGFVPPPKYT
jgi:amidase